VEFEFQLPPQLNHPIFPSADIRAIRFIAEMAASPCGIHFALVWQVGEGVSPTLDAKRNIGSHRRKSMCFAHFPFSFFFSVFSFPEFFFRFFGVRTRVGAHERFGVSPLLSSLPPSSAGIPHHRP
jgi:hypothetical protein